MWIAKSSMQQCFVVLHGSSFLIFFNQLRRLLLVYHCWSPMQSVLLWFGTRLCAEFHTYVIVLHRVNILHVCWPISSLKSPIGLSKEPFSTSVPIPSKANPVLRKHFVKLSGPTWFVATEIQQMASSTEVFFASSVIFLPTMIAAVALCSELLDT